MEVTPQLLKDVEFADRWRGYDQAEVDDFLERVAAGVAELRQRLQSLEARAEAAERRAAAAEAAVASSSDVGADTETIRRTLLLAQRTADAAVAEAQEQAAGTVEAAERRAAALVAEAEAEARRTVDDTRQRLLHEIAVLEGTRDALRSDVDLLERHLDDARHRLRASLGDLQEVLDHPELLRTPPAPELSGATARPVAGAGLDPAAAAAARALAGDDEPDRAAGEGAGGDPAGYDEPVTEAVPPVDGGGVGPWGGVERGDDDPDAVHPPQRLGGLGPFLGVDPGDDDPGERHPSGPAPAGGGAGPFAGVERADPGDADPGRRQRAPEALFDVDGPPGARRGFLRRR